MTVFGRDMSDFDTNNTVAGYSFITHKATEGISTKHAQLASRLNAARNAGVPVLGAYHVVRTPNSSNGTLQQQRDYWFSYMDSQVPWWRSYPHFLLQIDGELWPYDQVSPTTIKQFAALVSNSGTGKRVITYASHGQYGDGLSGIVTDLWNANYGTNNGVYPGDSSTRWDAYSGKTPVLLQYCSNPYDRNAYRGTVDQLLAYVGGGTDMNGPDTFVTMSGQTKTVYNFLGDVYDVAMNGKGPFAQHVATLLEDLTAGSPVTLTPDQLDALKTAMIAALPTAADIAALVPKPPTAAEIAVELATRLGNG